MTGCQIRARSESSCSTVHLSKGYFEMGGFRIGDDQGFSPDE